MGRSPPFRGGALRQARTHLARSGPRLLPFLVVNYALPHALARRGRGWLARIAAQRGIPVLDMPDMNGAAAHDVLHAVRPDLLVTLHCDQILSAATLAIPRLGGLNLHPSLLPLHRGPVPTIHALAEPVPRFGVTVHRLVPRIDAGPILAQRTVELPPGVTASAAARALHLAGATLLEQTVLDVAAGCAAERTATALPYCPFPPPALLRGLARQGRRVVGGRDIAAALRARVG